VRRSELYHHEEQETPPGAHGGNEVLPETPALYPAPRSTLSAGTEPLCGKKAAQGLLFFCFFVSRRARSRSRADECSGRGYQLPLLFDLPDGEKEMGVTGYSIENVTQVQEKNGVWQPIASDKDPTVIILHYPSIIDETIAYIPPRIKIEVSALSMDEPTTLCNIHSLIEESFEGEDTDANSKVKVVTPARTFLEKLFLLAEEFQKEKPRSVRMSRHLYDLEKLMNTQYGREALADITLYNAIVAHRKTYYALKYIDYSLHNPKTINFLIPKKEIESWKADYADMRRFFIYGNSLEFDVLMQKIAELQERVRNMCIR